MPFTLSHAAAVLPFRRTRLVMSALVMGCFVPDFPYLLSLIPSTFYGHTLPGVFFLDLPLALVSLWLFHSFLKQPMLMFLPLGFRRRLKTGLAAFSFWPLKRFLWIVASILIGIATHILWDSFTHSSYWLYRHWEFLRRPVALPIGGDTVMFKLLEYISSVFGLMVVAIWVWHWYRTTKPSASPVIAPVDSSQRWVLVVTLPALAILASLVRAYAAVGFDFHVRPLVHFTADTVISAITFFLLGLLFCGVVFRWQRVPKA
jgi:hypothetical protein